MTATRKRVFYLTVFPSCYPNQSYFYNKTRAKAFVKHVCEVYEIKGKVIKVQECK